MTKTQHNINHGLIAGLVATVILSILMITKASTGLMPKMDVINMLTQLSHNLIHTPSNSFVGWVIHFVIGTFVWGALFALFAKQWKMPNYTVKGVSFATLAWLLMMVVLMPAVGAGLFGVMLGMSVAVGTLLMHWVYGSVLGSIYGALDREE